MFEIKPLSYPGGFRTPASFVPRNKSPPGSAPRIGWLYLSDGVALRERKAHVIRGTCIRGTCLGSIPAWFDSSLFRSPASFVPSFIRTKLDSNSSLFALRFSSGSHSPEGWLTLTGRVALSPDWWLSGTEGSRDTCLGSIAAWVRSLVFCH